MARLNAVPSAPTCDQAGFTLTEMAVVLVIVALLIGGMILPMSAQHDLRQNTETQQVLADAGSAVAGFAASHTAADGRPYLPCPDTDNNGTENRTGSTCSSQEGNLPWADLGIGRQDAWGNPLRYRVSAAFSNSATGFSLLANGDIHVCDSSACTTTLTTTAPAVILSRGKNGLATPTQTDELENANFDNRFVQRNAGDGFDDLLSFMSTSLLINRMVTAGRLP